MKKKIEKQYNKLFLNPPDLNRVKTEYQKMLEKESDNESSERYGRVCDALCRTLWADRYGISKNDPFKHTSDEVRRVATAIFEAMEIN